MSLSSELLKYLAFTYRNITTIKRNIFQLAEIFFWPFITLISIGLMISYLKPGKEQTAVVLSGIVALSVLQTCQLDVAYVLLFDMWSKSLKHTLGAPIANRHYLVGGWIVGIIRGTVTFFIIVFFIRVFFKYDLLAAGAAATVRFLAGMLLSGLLIGMLTNIALYNFGWRAEIVPWSIVSVILLFCGIYYPVEVLTPILRKISYAIPITYFLEDYRAAFGAAAHPAASVKGFIVGGIYFVVIYTILVLSVKKAKRRGMIVRLSE